MSERRDDGSIAPRRGLGGPILPPPPPELAQKSAQESAQESSRASGESPTAKPRRQSELFGRPRKPTAQQADQSSGQSSGQSSSPSPGESSGPSPSQDATTTQEPVTEPGKTSRRPARAPRPPKAGRTDKAGKTRPATKQGAPRRTRRAQLRLVQVDAWSVMKTSFLLSIALGIVLVVAVAIIWSVLGAAGVWESINSIVQQAVGGDNSEPFDIREYVGTSRVLGFAMIVAVLDVILITAIATLGAFLYNLSAALLGGLEVTLAEDS